MSLYKYPQRRQTDAKVKSDMALYRRQHFFCPDLLALLRLLDWVSAEFANMARFDPKKRSFLLGLVFHEGSKR